MGDNKPASPLPPTPDRKRLADLGEALRQSYREALTEDVPKMLRDVLKDLE